MAPPRYGNQLTLSSSDMSLWTLPTDAATIATRPRGGIDYDFFRRRARRLRRAALRAWSVWAARCFVRLVTTRLVVSPLLIMPAYGLEAMSHGALGWSFGMA
jgi:hypothetical protein